MALAQKNTKVLVSVILPVYNAANYVAEAIDSILHQTFTNFECIIINDGSTDATEKVVLAYADERIRYYKNEQNVGLIQTLNKGLDVAKGKYIARMDADDICTPNRLQRQVNFLENNPDYVLVGTQKQNMGDAKPQKAMLADAHIRAHLLLGSAFVHPSVMMRKQTLNTHQLRYNPQHLHAEDYGLWVALSQYGKMANLPFVGIQYRLHGNQISQQFQQTMSEHSYSISLQYFQQLQVQLSHPHQQLLHQLFTRKTSATTLPEIQAWAAFFVGVAQQLPNRSSLQQPLRQMFYHKWVMICLNSQLKKRQLYPHFLKAQPTWWRFRVKYHLAFIKSCILNQ